MTPLERLVLSLRVTMEAAMVAALAYWGFHTGDTTLTKVLLAVGVPVVGFGFWGAVDFHQAGRFGEPLRLAQELAVSLLAALALYATGRHGAGIALAALSVLYHVLVYATGGRLLTSAQQTRRLSTNDRLNTR
jgi:hypothetical protein